MNAANRGSEWNRWDPHIHGPGTLHADAFRGSWEQYLEAIESATPTVRALGVTDYYVLRTYKQARKSKSTGRLQDVEFLFPNVEMRVGIATSRDRFVNLHLLFSPHEPDHVTQIERILGKLTFRYKGSTYDCTERDLIRLGREIDPDQSDELGALKVGANQFKVDIERLRGLYDAEPNWMHKNCLIAISGSGTDGVAGIRDSSFKALARELGSYAHIVFSANKTDREFWLGRKTGIGPHEIIHNYGFLKPCLHGSDAHDFQRLLAPEDNRYCWIRADLSFEGLRQVVMEPERRVSIGQEAPASSTRSETIDRVCVHDADWLETGDLALNSGLVAIIGARGSGKTALADMIARGADALGAELSDASFVGRAGRLLGNSSVELEWGDGKSDQRSLSPTGELAGRAPRIRYLSQRFVENLCSSAGLATGLLKEIETVIFNATDETERLGAARFKELRELKVATNHRTREHLVKRIAELSSKWTEDQILRTQLETKRKTSGRISTRLKTIEEELKSLGAKGKSGHAQDLARIQGACATVSARIQKQEAALTELDQLELEVGQALDANRELLDSWKHRYAGVGIDGKSWDQFELHYAGKPAEVVEERRRALRGQVATLRNGKVPASTQDQTAPPAYDTWPLAALEAKRAEVEQLVGLDQSRSRQYRQLQRELTQKKISANRLAEEVSHINGAAARQKNYISKRRSAYAAVFQTLVDDQKILESLYEPLSARLKGSGGTLGGLEFVVRRRVGLESWVSDGEGLIDLRKATELKYGGLKEAATELLLDAWTTGDANAVDTALSKFIERYVRLMISAHKLSGTEKMVDWYGRMASWLFSTEHVRLEYSVRYAGTEIERLSPGMRGIVLLILYLAVDEWDTRPLVVDQPEDNLDPKSVFKELVGFFRDARLRRQIILVTHNANLVVNADADQVIVAEAESGDAGQLPRFTYTSGGLDERQIRERVCDLLEGGEDAFREREKRYRLSPIR